MFLFFFLSDPTYTVGCCCSTDLKHKLWYFLNAALEGSEPRLVVQVKPDVFARSG